MSIAFYILGLVAIAGGIMAITLRNVIHAVFSVLLFFSALAGLFLLLLAEFIAAVQILVYIGSVGILMLFAIMLTTKVMGDSTRTVHSRGWIWGGLTVVALLLGVLIPFISMPHASTEHMLMHFNPSVKQLGLVLMNPYFASVGVIALLLTSGLIGAVVAASSAGEDKAQTPSDSAQNP
ncbi:MAG: NADH-quinone oxidoreductase subunit J [Verrucomicrobiae bacterium]|nr:NADH-quinone oxidoreductase subunit J [Verrucomicrobiae bacterium]